jgi:NADH-quinone oxidoreductase subunit C
MTKEQIENKIAQKFGSAIEIQQTKNLEAFIYVTVDKYIEVCKFLKSDPDLYFEYLFQMGGVHYPNDRFELMLTLSSHKHHHELVLKVKLSHDDPKISTASVVWEAANWYEREAMELYGIKFDGHPDPRPLLLYEDWEFGYPLRKGWTGPDFIPMPDKSKGGDD